MRDYDEMKAQYDAIKDDAERAIVRKAERNPWVVVAIVLAASAASFVIGYAVGSA